MAGALEKGRFGPRWVLLRGGDRDTPARPDSTGHVRTGGSDRKSYRQATPATAAHPRTASTHTTSTQTASTQTAGTGCRRKAAHAGTTCGAKPAQTRPVQGLLR
ncbi:hypothetical protein Airi01_099840 [Actinoallomurus iriomotensis]|uniref:Uncharacterized protein n=1 Tax=Actinoallomurus iriomotensis TaxID=478107 RepID=A0A9W6RX32_9ACTN|nr:hypothetical protein Airi01_099840 [Actinoallomurus iriomotensis]